jgi:hypothetical protein
LRAQIDRSQARLLLAEHKPAQARASFQALTGKSYGVDSNYFQLWAWDGVAQSAQAGDPAGALVAINHALDGVDQARSRFRSEEFKIGLFSDLQSVFDRAIGLHLAAGDARGAFDVSERSRARALLDAVRGARRWGRTPAAPCAWTSCRRSCGRTNGWWNFMRSRMRCRCGWLGRSRSKAAAIRCRATS